MSRWLLLMVLLALTGLASPVAATHLLAPCSGPCMIPSRELFVHDATTAFGGRLENSAKLAEARIAEEAEIREYIQTCLEIGKGMITQTRQQTADDCLTRAQRRLTAETGQVVCRLLIGRLGSFEVCIKIKIFWTPP